MQLDLYVLTYFTVRAPEQSIWERLTSWLPGSRSVPTEQSIPSSGQCQPPFMQSQVSTIPNSEFTEIQDRQMIQPATSGM